MKRSAVPRLRSGLPVLITESAKNFASLRKALNQEIQPNGEIERALVDDFAALTWEILRLRRIKTEIINSALFPALENILQQFLARDDFPSYLDREHAAEELARSWSECETAKAEVSKLLCKFQLDEGAIEAEAFRVRAQDLECVDRMLSLAAVRRDKCLCMIAEFRHRFAIQLQQAGDRILEDDVPQLVEVKRAG